MNSLKHKQKDIAPKPHLAEGELKAYLDHTSDNELEILSSSKVGCLSCGAVYSARDVHDWADEGGKMKAVCAHCGLPTVVGDASGLKIDKKSLDRLRRQPGYKAFDESNIEAIRDFCARYAEGKIAEDAKNEELFLFYCQKLCKQHDPIAIMDLADFYMRGGMSGKPDYDKALSYYELPEVAYSPLSLINKAIIFKRGSAKRKPNIAKCCDSLEKAALLGSVKARYMLSDLYTVGDGKREDPFFAFSLLESCYNFAYPVYLKKGFDPDADLGEIAIRLMQHYYYGIGTPVDMDAALAFAMVFTFCLALNKGEYCDAVLDEVDAILSDVSKKRGYTFGELVQDYDTFNDSLYLMPESMLKHITRFDYNEKEGTLSFSLNCLSPFLLVDLANLSVKRVNKGATFVFDRVASIEIQEPRTPISFNYSIAEDGSLSFYRLDEDDPIATIYFKKDGEQ